MLELIVWIKKKRNLCAVHCWHIVPHFSRAHGHAHTLWVNICSEAETVKQTFEYSFWWIMISTLKSNICYQRCHSHTKCEDVEEIHWWELLWSELMKTAAFDFFLGFKDNRILSLCGAVRQWCGSRLGLWLRYIFKATGKMKKLYFWICRSFLATIANTLLERLALKMFVSGEMSSNHVLNGLSMYLYAVTPYWNWKNATMLDWEILKLPSLSSGKE